MGMTPDPTRPRFFLASIARTPAYGSTRTPLPGEVDVDGSAGVARILSRQAGAQ